MTCNNKHLKAYPCNPSPIVPNIIILRLSSPPLRPEGGITPIATSRRPIALQGVRGKKAQSVRLLMIFVFPCSAFVYCTTMYYTTVGSDGTMFLLYSSSAVSRSSMLSVLCSSTSMRSRTGWIVNSMVLAQHSRRRQRRMCMRFLRWNLAYCRGEISKRVAAPEGYCKDLVPCFLTL